ncbi:hypothetical protein EJ110_NYTH36747 [Nymphaea thermarum]|nr:hypothetical protein EJ110_NYTH36747 [Nymphaea thermarum]
MVQCELCSILWALAQHSDFDASILKSGKRNDRLEDAVVTVPKGTMLLLGSVNVVFDRELIGPALFSGLVLARQRKSGTYKRRGDGETAQEIQMKCTMEGTSLIKMTVLFFQSVMLPQSAVTTEECFVEMAKLVSEELGPADPSFARGPDVMEEWVRV